MKRRSLSRGLKGTYLALVLAFLYLPIAVMIALSFNESVSRAEWTGFTFQWYAKLLERQDIIQALNLTVRVAFEATVAATIIGTFGAIGIHAMKKGWAGPSAAWPSSFPSVLCWASSWLKAAVPSALRRH